MEDIAGDEARWKLMALMKMYSVTVVYFSFIPCWDMVR